ncbi:hypothetical protein [Rhizobium esperanzae]|uniref:Uncharacterized protein n=1 Tax=Rhizobium esperanzae TaxID=1967781 RepID=A0A7W6R9H4_9HYPH|nr:hypothetical protein [Rhizobium esperanzae]MBB4238657.1 hypothetical protein [Rhizobium esperanzae]
MIDRISQLLDVDQSKELSSLEPVSKEKLSSIAALYPAISQQYLEFIRVIGVGSTTRGFYIYEPSPHPWLNNIPRFSFINLPVIARFMERAQKAIPFLPMRSQLRTAELPGAIASGHREEKVSFVWIWPAHSSSRKPMISFLSCWPT